MAIRHARSLAGPLSGALLCLGASPGAAVDEIDATPQMVAEAQAPDDAALDQPERGTLPAAEGLTPELSWSASIFGQYRAIDSPYDRDRRGGFFDQYQFTPNKDATAPLQLGVREARVDWVRDDEPLVLFRYDSPAANLDLTGSEPDDAFLDQRALLLGRSSGFAIDLDYRRIRSEQLRVYPETQAAGAALPFSDLTRRNDRFYRNRTGFQGELRWRPGDSFPKTGDALAWLSPELALRGGYDRRDGRRQRLTLLHPANDWVGFAQEYGDDVSDLGGGVLVAPGRLFTLTLDFDQQDFDANRAQLDDSLPFASSSRSLDFVPSTRRRTGEAGLHLRIGERAVVTAGFQLTRLEQDERRTPAQQAVGLDTNKTTVYSARLAGDLRVTDDIAANAWLKYVFRDHDIDQKTPLFGRNGSQQVDEFLDTFHRFDAGAEGVYRPRRGVKLALGVRTLFVHRNLDFPRTGFGNPVILEENAWVNDDTQMWTVYGRADLRPFRGVGLRTELSYRDAPDTGYVTDLDGYLEGSLRASYVVPVARPTNVQLHVAGGMGHNSDFSGVEGVGPGPDGATRRRRYERSHWTLGLTGDSAVRDDLTVFASLYFSEDEQSDDLLLSNLQRYFQQAVPITFRKLDDLDARTRELGLVLGSQLWLSERTDLGLSYAFTFAETRYLDPGSMPPLARIGDNRIVDAEIHSLDLELRHQVRKGLRVFAGYGVQHYADDAPKPGSPGSSLQPGDRSDFRQTVTVGVTLNSELLDR